MRSLRANPLAGVAASSLPRLTISTATLQTANVPTYNLCANLAIAERPYGKTADLEGNQPMEIRECPSYPFHRVSRCGTVVLYFNRYREWVRLRMVMYGKYPAVRTWRERTAVATMVPVHWLVSDAFLPPRPLGMVIRHLNDDKEDTHADNLAYGTRKDNTRCIS